MGENYEDYEIEPWRGFKFQNGEIEDISAAIKENGHAEAELDDESEIEGLIKDLEHYGIYKVVGSEYDYNAIDTVDYPDFFARVKFAEKKCSISELKRDEVLEIDFFIIPEDEESYDEIGWG